MEPQNEWSLLESNCHDRFDLCGSAMYSGWYLAKSYSIDKTGEILVEAEVQIREIDQRIPCIPWTLSRNSKTKRSYKTIINAMKEGCSMIWLHNVGLAYVIKDLCLRLKEYATDELFEDVRNAAEELKKMRIKSKFINGE